MPRKRLWVFVFHNHVPHAKVLTIPCGSRRNYVNKSDWWEIFIRDSGFVQPHALLCGQVGIAPISINTTMINRIVPNDISFLFCDITRWGSATWNFNAASKSGWPYLENNRFREPFAIIRLLSADTHRAVAHITHNITRFKNIELTGSRANDRRKRT